jgi:predicted enzyme related to lactoylglutathione lyase
LVSIPTATRQGMTGPVCFRHVNDIQETLQLLRGAGARGQQEATNVGGGKLIASVGDADGNVIGLIQVAS